MPIKINPITQNLQPQTSIAFDSQNPFVWCVIELKIISQRLNPNDKNQNVIMKMRPLTGK